MTETDKEIIEILHKEDTKTARNLIILKYCNVGICAVCELYHIHQKYVTEGRAISECCIFGSNDLSLVYEHYMIIDRERKFNELLNDDKNGSS